ncbi:hypothetical protein RchiOBHm_Chr2g0147921 [Rosa chinensis]|uniref:Uncharacterized protein n=1 Tax=Rosa chinensis TaxID=74649 RepID=A0A2P6RZB4_ROSCH|nr:hypothetical protein RchiOBHm_Chr2g0147921 [Rosa chinensis]
MEFRQLLSQGYLWPKLVKQIRIYLWNFGNYSLLRYSWPKLMKKIRKSLYNFGKDIY